MNTLKPKWPPLWAPLQPEGPAWSKGEAFQEWDRVAKAAFDSSVDDKRRALVLREYVLANLHSCLQSQWLGFELLQRVHRYPRDLVVRTYAHTLVQYGALQVKYGHSPKIASRPQPGARVRTGKPLVPPRWKPEDSDRSGHEWPVLGWPPKKWRTVSDNYARWEEASYAEFIKARSDGDRCTVVKTYLLANLNVSLQSKWLASELTKRVPVRQDPLVWVYAQTLLNYASWNAKWGLQVIKAKRAYEFRTKLRDNELLSKLWKRVRDRRRNLADGLRIKQVQNHFRSDPAVIAFLHQARLGCSVPEFLRILAIAPSKTFVVDHLAGLRFPLHGNKSATRTYHDIWRDGWIRQVIS